MLLQPWACQLVRLALGLAVVSCKVHLRLAWPPLQLLSLQLLTVFSDH
jgi:hypothetical protein